MRVLFDAYWWVEGPLSNQMVQRQFIDTWVHDYPEDEVALLVPAWHRAAVSTDVGDRMSVLSTWLRPHGVAAPIALSSAARRHRADIVISHNFTPLVGRSVTFVHDVLFRTNPEWFTTAERIYLSPISPLARRAAAIVTSTRHEAGQISTLDPGVGTVVATGLAPAPNLASTDPVRPAGLPDTAEYVLTVGRLNIRKNLERTIAAALASDRLSVERPLVVVGEPDGRRAELGARAQDARDSGSLVFLPRVSDAELVWLYSNAALFVFLSLGEGYGLPPVEAAYFGTPVMVSDLPVFHETMGDRAHFVDPTDVARAAALMARMLDEPTSRAPAGRLPHGDWQACTRRLRAVVEQVVAERHDRERSRRRGTPRPLRIGRRGKRRAGESG